MIIAAPGGGKTLVLIARAIYIAESGVDASSILCVTFTNNAADEIRARLAGTKAASAEVSTIHSVGYGIICRHYNELGFKEMPAPMDTDDIDEMLGTVMRRAVIRYDDRNIKDMRTMISQAKKARKTTLSGEADNSIYQGYISLQRQESVVDYDDMIVMPLELLENNEQIRDIESKRYKYIQVDEFQDTSKVQLKLLEYLAEGWKNFCVIGDPNQCIYGFQGADIGSMMRFREKHEEDGEVTVAKMTENFRSTSTIVDAARAIAKKYGQPDTTDMKPAKPVVGEKIRLSSHVNDYDQAEYIAGEIRNLIQKGYEENDIAILYRNNKMADTMVRHLEKYGINYYVMKNDEGTPRGAREALAYLKVITEAPGTASLIKTAFISDRLDLDNEDELRACLEKPGKNTIETLIAFAKESGDSHNVAYFEILKKYRDKIRQGEPVGETLQALLDNIGFMDYATACYSKGSAEQIIGLIKRIKKIEKAAPQTTQGPERTRMILEKLALAKNGDRHMNDGVRLMTIHKAKGLEFRAVFLIHVEEEVFIYKDTAAKEAACLFYVGITRAKELLYIAYCTSKSINNRTDKTSPLSLIDDIPQHLVDIIPFPQNRLIS